MRNTPNPSSNPTAANPAWLESGEIRGSTQTSKALSLLRMAALSLPGLAMNAATADEGYAVSNDSSGLVGIQAATNYIPTGASKLVGQLGKEPTSTNKYRINCYDDGVGEPKRLRLRIQGMTGSAKFLVNATIERNGVSQSVTDPVNGDHKYSDYIFVSEGPGDYILTVSKVKKTETSPDSSLTGTMTFQTQQECNPANEKDYTGIKKPVPIDIGSTFKLKTYSSSLGKSVDNKTLFVTCSASKSGENTARYKFQIKAATKNRPFTARMTVKKDGEEVSVVDPISGDKNFSDLMALEGGNGRYEVIVAKDPESGDTAKAMSFAINHGCETESLSNGKMSVSKK